MDDQRWQAQLDAFARSSIEATADVFATEQVLDALEARLSELPVDGDPVSRILLEDSIVIARHNNATAARFLEIDELLTVMAVALRDLHKRVTALEQRAGEPRLSGPRS